MFAPAARAEPTRRGAASSRSTPDDGPEPLIGGAVDLGAIATEFLILGIDPYPRKPDAVFEAPRPETTSVKPFAALAALKKGQGGSAG